MLLDKILTIDNLIASVSKSVHYHIRGLRHICSSITKIAMMVPQRLFQVIGYDFSPWASSATEVTKETKFGTKVTQDEDDARTSNTHIAQRKRAMPH